MVSWYIIPIHKYLLATSRSSLSGLHKMGDCLDCSPLYIPNLLVIFKLPYVICTIAKCPRAVSYAHKNDIILIYNRFYPSEPSPVSCS